MAYEIRNVEDDQWSVIDDDSLPVFTATLPQCENWLPKGTVGEMRPENSRNQRLIRIWRRLPVPLTRWIGPWIVRGIP